MSTADRLADMPAWPILMNAATAALYLEISSGSFLALARRTRIQPVDLGLGVVRWRRDDLDRLVAELPHRGGAATPEPANCDFDAALARSSKRLAEPRGRSRRNSP